MNRAWRRAHRVKTSIVKHSLDEKTEWELQDIANDMTDGIVFTHMQVPTIEQIPLVFPVITMLGRHNAEWFSQNVGLIYEELSESVALPNTNGLPRFTTLKALNKAQGADVIRRYNEVMETRSKNSKSEYHEPGNSKTDLDTESERQQRKDALADEKENVRIKTTEAMHRIQSALQNEEA